MKRIWFFVLMLSVHWAWAQKIKVKTTSRMPKDLIETSGLLAGVGHTVWTHNDSGGETILYQINNQGEILRKVWVSNAQNVDWEALASDYKAWVYIADIGNNANRRKDLRIYKIPHPDSLTTDTVQAEIIDFYYPNQKAFPPTSRHLNFDAEALIAYDDSLFIFTKNRTKPYSCYTYVYALKNTSGKQVATLKDSIYLPKTRRYFSWVTDAARHPFKDELVLISHKKAWIIHHFRTKPQLTPTKISGIFSQKEGVCFDLDGNVWVSNEKYCFLKPKLKFGHIKHY